MIGGTGLEQPLHRTAGWALRQVATASGPVTLWVGSVRGESVAFLPRHGPDHGVPPHRIDYRGQVEALRRLGVQRVAATAAVGSLRPDLAPGSLVVLDQFIDMTRRRPATWFEAESGATHVDFTEPYCPEVRSSLLAAAARLGVAVADGGCYVGVDGPRYETPAEVRAFRLLGGDVVGMTGLPEAVLAREAGLCYASVAVVTNLGAGLAPGPLSHGEVARAVEALRPRLVELLLEALLSLSESRSCRCGVLH